jgi:hypothetical protein
MALYRRLDVLLRLAAALVACPPVALYSSLALAAFLPASDEVRAAIGYLIPLPLYTVYACMAARARSGPIAWIACIGALTLLRLALSLQ